jgi:hypothetical protein
LLVARLVQVVIKIIDGSLQDEKPLISDDIPADLDLSDLPRCERRIC